MNIFKLFGTATLGLLLLPQLANAQASAPILGGTANITGGTISGAQVTLPTGAWGSSALATYDPIHQYGNISGTPNTNQNAFGIDLVQYDTGTVKGANMSGIADTLLLNGSTITGSRIAIQGTLAVIAPTGNAGTGSYTSGWFQADAQANDGGTSGTFAGGIFGTNPQVNFTSGATYWAQGVGEEIDVNAYAGSSVGQLVGLQIGKASASTDVNGSQANIAMAIQGAVDATTYDVGWNCGLCFGTYSGYNSMRTTGSLISTFSHAGTVGGSTGDTVAYGINLSGYTFSTSAFKSNLFNVDGSGNLTASNVTTNSLLGSGASFYIEQVGTGNVYIGNTSNGQALIVADPTSTVDDIIIIGGTSGNGVTLGSYSGTDTSVNLNISAKGVGAIVAKSPLEISSATTLTSAGTTQGTAYALTKDISVFTTVASGSGAVVQANVGQRQEIFNRGANALLIYPFTGAQIESAGTNTAVSLATGGHVTIECFSTTQCYITP